MPGVAQEKTGIIRHGAKMLFAYSEATVPKITVYLRKGYGGAKQAMCTRELGADAVLVWPGVELAVMGAEGAVDVLYRREIESAQNPEEVRQQKIAEFNQRFSGPFDALSKQYAQAAIQPRETRARLIRLLRVLAGKQQEPPRKKHSVMPV
jgi:acetyl-CoA carboxylase carboxyltransferase component